MAVLPARAARRQRAASAVEAKGAVEPVAHGKAVGMAERDQRGGDGEAEALDQNADLRRLAVGFGDGSEAIGGLVGDAGAHGRMLLR